MSKSKKPKLEVVPEELETAVEETETVQDETVESAEEAPAESAAEASEEEAEPLQLQLLRLGADFDNFRKRTRREKEIWTQQAQERIVTELLSVVDHYELGLNNAEQHEAKKEVLDGFRMVHTQFLNVLNRFGVKAIDAETSVFDPALHEAVSFLNSDDKAENEIIAETRKGYTMGDKLLRAAQVVVSSGSAASAENADDQGEGEEG
jgi:molecular chaperone GrpE